MDLVYCIEKAEVVSDIIDGEAIMLHRTFGDYFSTEGVGGLIWQWIGEGRSRSQILNMLNARFSASLAEIATAVDSFLDDLVAHKLVRQIVEGDESATETLIEPQKTNAEVEFVRPTLHVYSDIRNMVLLDPIHDVDENSGWPMPRRTDDPA
jgi:Coenzyme PQQ synthesis protein D (PqqD)